METIWMFVVVGGPIILALALGAAILKNRRARRDR